MVVALSGGGDSLALLHLLLDRGEKVLAAHLDHGLRSESGSEVDWLRSHCESLGVELITRRVSISRLAQRWGCGLEAAGRRARYRWLKCLSAELDAVVCTAHTREDQAETLLMRIVQGCSVAGLRGIRPRWGQWLFRPLLCCGREELREHLRESGIPWLEDPTNQDTSRLRAWARHRLLPLLRERNPRIEEHLCGLARSAGGEDYRAVARLWRAADPQARMTRKHLLWLSQLNVGQQCSLPGGFTARREREGLHFESTRKSVGPSLSPPEPVFLTGEGTTALLDWGLRVSICSFGHADDQTQGGAWSVLLRSDLPQPLSIRGRRDGDRFGRARLKKIFHELAIEPRMRSRCPLLVDGEGHVIWIIGRRVRPEALSTDTGILISVSP